MSRVLHFAASTALSASASEVFDFHQNPENIRKIAPASLHIIEIQAEPVARPGATFRLRARQFGLPICWTGLWETVQPPVLLVDTALEAPFRQWRHEHHFLPQPNGCLLTDRVSFLPPLGILGHLALRLVLAQMFRARHRATRAFFSTASSSFQPLN